MADVGFSKVGVSTLQGVPTYNFAKFPQKLHEIEIIGPLGMSLMPPLDLPLFCVSYHMIGMM